MARCGCASACSCAVIGSDLVDVVGTGNPSNPYVVSISCAGVRTCFSGDGGIEIDPDTGVISINCGTVRECFSGTGVVEYDPATGVINVDCDGIRSCISGTGLVEYDEATGVINVDCEGIRTCISEGPGIDYDPVTGVISAKISTDAGNSTIIGSDGGIFTPPGGGSGSTPITVGCGILQPTPYTIRANTSNWDFACPQDANATPVYCNPTTGRLQGPPRTGFVPGVVATDMESFPAPGVAVPATMTETLFCEAVYTNPSCYPIAVVEYHVAHVNWRANEQANLQAGIDGDEFFSWRTSTPANISEPGMQTTKTYTTDILAPGASQTYRTALTERNTGTAGTGRSTFRQVTIRTYGITVA